MKGRQTHPEVPNCFDIIYFISRFPFIPWLVGKVGFPPSKDNCTPFRLIFSSFAFGQALDDKSCFLA